MNKDLKRVDQWLADNRMIPNVKKTKSMVIGSRHALKRANDIEIYLDNEILDVVTTFDYLGVRISDILSWEQHVSRICQRLYPKLGLLNRISSFLPSVILLRIYKQTILPILDYGSTVWHEVRNNSNEAGRETTESCFEDYPSQRKAKMLSRDAQRTEAADIAQHFTLYEYFQDTVQLGLPQSTERYVQIQTLHAQQRPEG